MNIMVSWLTFRQSFNKAYPWLVRGNLVHPLRLLRHDTYTFFSREKIDVKKRRWKGIHAQLFFAFFDQIWTGYYTVLGDFDSQTETNRDRHTKTYRHLIQAMADIQTETDRQTDRQTDRLTDRQIDGQPDRQTDRKTDRDWQTERQAVRRTDRQRQTDRQADRHR